MTFGGEVEARAYMEMAVLSQVTRNFENAQRLFEAYIERLPEADREVFLDFSLVASREDLAFYERTPDDQKAEMRQRFWNRLDPAPLTQANERLVEHYRRVAFAREHFGEYTFPWDDRGEAYIRYGNPDHVSQSGSGINIERHPRVVAVKEQLIARAGSAAIALSRRRVDPVESSMTGPRGELDRPDRATRQRQVDANFMGWPVYPVPIDGRWEYWIYTEVGPGIEVTFVQRNYPGPYEYAEMPLGRGRHARIWQDLNPEMVIQQVAVRRPNTYRPDFATGPLDFHFTTAAFRGEEGQTALEVYYGIPTGQLAYVTCVDGQQVAHLDRGVAVYDGTGRKVYRSSQEMLLKASTGVDQSAGALIPELDRVLLPPGSYRVSVQVRDRRSGKSQVYNQSRMVPAFEVDEKLRMSDVELAASIDVADQGRFLKQDIAVIPMASQAYLAKQPVFIYYELYNLKRNDFGQTKYRVSYEVRSLEKKVVGARILGGLGKLLGKQESGEVVTIEYEQTGTNPRERGYLELDMSNTEPGTQSLKILVTDENNGQTVGASTTFTIR